MLKSPTREPAKLIREARRLEKEGAEAIRLAVRTESDAGLLGFLRKNISLPLVADIHFHYKLALSAIEAGFEGIRLNPLNIYKPGQVKQVIKMAKRYGVSVRVGVNSGGFRKKFSSSGDLARHMVKEVEAYLKILEAESFSDIMVSLKGSDVASTIIANRMFSQKYSWPLHLGVTATGPFWEAVVKSSIALGNLLYDGIGSVIRVSLSAPSFWEVRIAKYILQALGLRQFGPEIISCPTCSRCEVDLIGIVERFKKALAERDIHKPLRIALMGCVVNGPGEACQADIGAAFGRKKAVIFKKNKIIGQSTERKIIEDLLKEAVLLGAEAKRKPQ
jgi:(E)-4-hydroxy-3-methylbut-2-enyl-diphosphate synthase